jgi:hypothetical protein
MDTNVPSYGDNLDILRRYLPDATDAQLLALEDTWHWGVSAEATGRGPEGTDDRRGHLARVVHRPSRERTT